MNRIVFLFLSVAILGMSNCNKPGVNILPYGPIPAILGIDYDNDMYTLVTSSETLLAPEITYSLMLEYGFFEGDAVLAYYSVNYDQQPYEGRITVTDVSFERMDPSYMYPEESIEITENFNISIISIDGLSRVEYQGNIVFFLLFNHFSLPNKFEYVMTYGTITEEETPIVYIRARTIEEGANAGNFRIINAFVMSDFLYQLKSKGINEFDIMYVEIGHNGEEVFRNWTGNPVPVEVD